jgi:hypothetical protein
MCIEIETPTLQDLVWNNDKQFKKTSSKSINTQPILTSINFYTP